MKMPGERLNDMLSVITVGEGPPLVFLPGLGAGADLSAAVPPPVERSARLVAVGSRRTVHLINRPIDMPSGTTIAELAGWHAAAIRGRFGAPVDVMGASGGGIIALQLAMDHVDVVRRLVIQVAASRVSDRGRHDLLRSAELERRGQSSAWLSSGLVARGLLRLVTASMYACAGVHPRSSGEVALIEAIQEWDVTERLGEIRAPTLVVTGTRDPLIPAELAEATALGIPNGRLFVVHGRGHMTTLLDPRVMREIRSFLNQPHT